MAERTPPGPEKRPRGPGSRRRATALSTSWSAPPPACRGKRGIPGGPTPCCSTIPSRSPSAAAAPPLPGSSGASETASASTATSAATVRDPLPRPGSGRRGSPSSPRTRPRKLQPSTSCSSTRPAAGAPPISRGRRSSGFVRRGKRRTGCWRRGTGGSRAGTSTACRSCSQGRGPGAPGWCSIRAPGSPGGFRQSRCSACGGGSTGWPPPKRSWGHWLPAGSPEKLAAAALESGAAVGGRQEGKPRGPVRQPRR